MQSRTMNQKAFSIIHHAYGQSEVEKALFLEEKRKKGITFYEDRKLYLKLYAVSNLFTPWV